jgi:hypothetical protein
MIYNLDYNGPNKFKEFYQLYEAICLSEKAVSNILVIDQLTIKYLRPSTFFLSILVLIFITKFAAVLGHLYTVVV